MNKESSRSIYVVAGVITDIRGKILLSRRQGESDMAGLWEFPGGKLEEGETCEQALIRELKEELGIDVEVGEKLICVPYQAPSKHLQLDVRKIKRWRGTPIGREGQALAWVAPDKLHRYAMPPADLPAVAALLQPSIYGITPEPNLEQGQDLAWLERLEQVIQKYQPLRIQLRSKRYQNTAVWETLVKAAVTICRRYQVEVLINSSVEWAQRFNIGVHLTQAQLMATKNRPLSDELLVSASCHSRQELVQAEQLGCNFVVLSPVQFTASHPEQTPIGWQGVAELRKYSTLPIYALGGLGKNDLEQARQYGAQGIAGISQFWSV